MVSRSFFYISEDFVVVSMDCPYRQACDGHYDPSQNIGPQTFPSSTRSTLLFFVVAVALQLLP